MSDIIDVITRHQVHLEQLKASHSKRFEVFLRKLDKRLRAELAKHDLTEFTLARLNKLIRSIDKISDNVYDEFTDEYLAELLDAAVYESEFEAKVLQNGAPKHFEAVIPSKAQVKAALFTTPLSVRGAYGGMLLKPFVKEWSRKDARIYSNTIRQGFFEGATTQQIVTRLRGTKAKNYRDGQLDVSRRHAEAMVRTSLQQASTTARFETLKENDVERYRIVATLDGRTTTQCRSLDGQEFEMGKGPLPPFHISCRTTFIPVPPKGMGWLSEGRTRSSKNGYVDGKQTYYEWLKTQPEGFQNDVLGPTRAKLFRDGGLSAERFAKLNLDKNFKPLTLAEMRKKEPIAFQKMQQADELTKQAKRVKIKAQRQQKQMSDWLGEKEYRRFAGANENRRIKKRMEELSLTQAEGVAVRSYTGAYYKNYNDFLWGVSSENLSDQVNVLRNALDKLPDHQGMTYRRTTLPESVLAEHQVGNVVEYKGFTSTSYGGDVFKGSHRIIFEGHSGKSVGWISEYGDKEKEVLFNSPKKFFVKNRYTSEDGILTLELIEI